MERQLRAGTGASRGECGKFLVSLITTRRHRDRRSKSSEGGKEEWVLSLEYALGLGDLQGNRDYGPKVHEDCATTRRWNVDVDAETVPAFVIFCVRPEG